jgi:enoyl-CoA hydratase/carnithine racemase
MSRSVQVHQVESVWMLTINRPDKRNALDAECVEQLIDAVEQAHAARADVLVLRGEGKNLCAGFDFTGFEKASEGDLLWRFVRIEQFLQMVAASPALTVGLAHGKNFGAGVDLLAACQFRVGSSDASFRMPGLKFGLVLGTRRLAQLIGIEQAREIQQVAKTIEAADALELGLLSELAEPDAWSGVVASRRETALSLAPDTRARLYQVLNQAQDDTDLANLVRSVMVPGLKERIAKYRAGV